MRPTLLTTRQARCLELEGQNAELKGVVAEVTARMEKYRKAYKDIGESVLVIHSMFAWGFYFRDDRM